MKITFLFSGLFFYSSVILAEFENVNKVQLNDGIYITFLPDIYVKNFNKTKNTVVSNGQEVEAKSFLYVLPKDKVVKANNGVGFYQNMSELSQIQAQSNSAESPPFNCGYCQVVVDQDGVIYKIAHNITLTSISSGDVVYDLEGVELKRYNDNLKTAVLKITEMNKFKNIIKYLCDKDLKYRLDLKSSFPTLR